MSPRASSATSRASACSPGPKGHHLPHLPPIESRVRTAPPRRPSSRARARPAAGPDPRLKTELLELRTRLGRLNTETTELKTFRAVALSRLRPPEVGTRSPLRFRARPAGRPVVDGRRVGAPGWR